ncbi:uncharacterized protein LOC128740937 [Sabethes cyaneus]|uniref:uncharacterized protein LOC128740937 n=1 Tax=Sabethes cyaneus TaxID=53552 RepID=UPI00237D7351|nr:uncharacterized protein LOC128740937 [Sabethes cyaneus]
MATVSHAPPTEPTSAGAAAAAVPAGPLQAAERRRKTASPYRTIPVKSQYTKSPSKVSRNNTFIAPSRGKPNDSNRGGDQPEEPPAVLAKAKCFSAGAVDELRERSQEDSTVEYVFQGEDVKFSGKFFFVVTVLIGFTQPFVVEEIETLEERGQPPAAAAGPVVLPTKRASSIPIKNKTLIGRPIRSQRSLISGSDSKTIKFLLKLTTKSYFETLKYEIDRIKESDRKMQDQASSHGHSIMALINKGIDFDRKMEDLRSQNARLLVETREKQRVQQDTVNAITSELNELKSVCNLLLKNIEKDHELDVLARKLRKSKKFDSNTYKMLKSQLRKPTQAKVDSVKVTAPKRSSSCLPSKSKSENILHKQRSRTTKASRLSVMRQKSDWSSLSSMSSVSTDGSDMLSDIEVTTDKRSGTSGGSRRRSVKMSGGAAGSVSVWSPYCQNGVSRVKTALRRVRRHCDAGPGRTEQTLALLGLVLLLALCSNLIG